MKNFILLSALFFFVTQFVNAQSGAPDPSFGKNGIVKTDIGKSYTYASFGRQVIEQSDGTIYLILHTGNKDYGDQYFITKRNADGSLNSAYGHNGFTTSVKMEEAGAALQLDGKIVMGGSVFTGFGDFEIVLARFNSNGSLDSSFGNYGKVITTPFSMSSTSPRTVVLVNNFKTIVASGSAIARYNLNGSLDSTFGKNGIYATDFTIAGGAVQNDGKIVVTSGSILARYNTDGSPDKTFSEDGVQTTDFDYSSYVGRSNPVAIQSDGKIVITGYSGKYNSSIIARYNSDGRLDRSFSGDGKVIHKFPFDDINAVYSIAAESKGKIVVGVNTGNDSSRNFTLARFSNNGSLDKTFSKDGIEANAFEIASVAIEQEGKIIVGGFLNSNFALARYTANGARDNTFGMNGMLTGSIHSGYTTYNGEVIQKDGKIVVAGKTWNGSNFDFVVARYNTDGSLDNSFNADGVQTTDFTSKDDYANAIAIQSDGKVVVAGNNFSVARYNMDGSLDKTFSGDGKLQTDFNDTSRTASAIAIQSDGKIVVAGRATTKDENGYYNDYFAIARYNTDGSLDKTFDGDGKQTVGFPNPEYGDVPGFATSVAIQSNGKIVVAGITGFLGLSSGVSIARFNIDGSLDPAFGNDGKIGGMGSENQLWCSMAIQKDGKIVVGGIDWYRGNSSDFIARFNIDGSPDITNKIEFPFDLSISPFDYDFGNGVAIQSNGKIVLSGFALSVYNTNGGFDSTFGNNGKIVTPVSEKNLFISSIAVSGNKLYAAGKGKNPGDVGVVARYLLDNSNTPPTVSLTTPANNAHYIAPVNIKLSAAASDADGTISKVEFYNGTALLHTEHVIPYGFMWRNVPAGNYTLTAKAYDNSGLVTTSAPVHISVVPNKPPTVSITNPANGASFTTADTILLVAFAADDGRVARVEFYNGTTLLRTEYKFPYRYHWTNVAAGTYTVTAVAIDNYGAKTTSAPVTVTVTSQGAMIVNSRPSHDNKTDLNGFINLKLAPNPATDIVNIYTQGLQQDKQAMISVISASGVLMNTMQLNSSAKTIQLDVSSLVSGVYTIKLISGDKVLYRQFAKL